jgi:hypothetical protein
MQFEIITGSTLDGSFNRTVMTAEELNRIDILEWASRCTIFQIRPLV